MSIIEKPCITEWEQCKKMLTVLICATVFLSGCKERRYNPTGKTCMGTDNDSLIEGLKGEVPERRYYSDKKNPAYFCDFKVRLLLIITIVLYVSIPECKAEEQLKEADISQEKTANLNP